MLHMLYMLYMCIVCIYMGMCAYIISAILFVNDNIARPFGTSLAGGGATSHVPGAEKAAPTTPCTILIDSNNTVLFHAFTLA